MKKAAILLGLIGVIGMLPEAWHAEPSREADRFWAQWRGPLGTGVAPQSEPPIEWSETKNVRWKVAIPGKGSSSPIVWGEQVFVTTATPTGDPVKAPEPEPPPSADGRGPRPRIRPEFVQDFSIFALDRRSGKILWQRSLRKELPHEGTHPTGTWASNSPVTDGKHVFAYFGSRGLYCLDMKGKLIWEKILGAMTVKMGFGEGSSPALSGDKLVLNWDHEGQSFITALDKNTGKELWRVDRDEPTSWSSPLILEHQGKLQVITNATNRIRSYDLETGKVLWEGSGMTANAIPTPVASGGMVYITSGFRGSALFAIRLASASGDIHANDSIAWKLDRDTPYVPSPLLYGDSIYILKSNTGILSSFHARTGEAHFREQRLEAVPNVYASPVGAGNRVYIAGREGTTAVLEHGPSFKVLAANTLDDGFDASPAVAGHDIYLRGNKFLYCIGKN